ncbi:MAG: polysaccharide deacetylase family protein [Atopobiaceae bacterium]|nr:polysaccharide deacetylase family protein [Atopobiaceae bacterium]MCH4180855.1 polysaccharide deacetylase family protein [Atopobiaceae bacterium]MCH4213472.1 polysaccharide deacetylase family protein [Atopobiaceae bacterium]MCH4230428.1 polysaccharide deacetylase family protein [Atopobiaceae bacterium]MCH4277141.1 polysaccharide deacetylase family protein [Atopobiaceae bacterium]
MTSSQKRYDASSASRAHAHATSPHSSNGYRPAESRAASTDGYQAQSGSAFSRGANGYYSAGAGSPHAARGYSSRVASASDRADAQGRSGSRAYGAHSAGSNPYLSQQGQGGKAPKRRGHKNVTTIVLVLLVAIAVGGVYFFLNPPYFNVTVNGDTHQVKSGTTISEAITAGYASPKAGNLLAIDGSVITEGGGNAFVATLADGSTTSDGTTKLTKEETLTIGDGTDTTESSTTTTEEIPYKTVGTDVTATDYYKGALHVYSQGTNGEQTTTTGDVSGKTTTQVTKEAQDAGLIIGDANTQGTKVIALTFDDGPWSTTNDLLDVLEENGAKATFFTIGNQISEYPDAVKRASSMGCQICTHTWDHAAGSGQGVNITYMTADEQTEEVNKGFSAIDDLLGTKVSRVFRAPGGNFYGSAVTNLQPLLTAEIGWDIDTEDWRRPGADSIKSQILKAYPGCVILMHDGGGDRTQTIEALKTALPELKAEGYSFVTIDELLAYGVDTSSSTSA